jgi:GWxTD domain-containing protein
MQLGRITGKTIFAVFMAVLCLRAQNESTHPDETISNFFVEAFASASDQPGKGHIDIYIQIPYPEIHFIKENEQYTGRFEISAVILSQEKQQLWQNSQLVELHLNNFSQTTSDRYSNLKQFSTELAPGKYELLLQVSDQESKKIATIKRSIVVKNFENDTLGLSDVMLVRRVSTDGTRKNIVPILSGVISKEQTSVYLFFEIYNRVQIDSVTVRCKFINSKREVVAQRTNSELLTGHRTQVILQLDTLSIVPDQYLLVLEATGTLKADSSKSFQTSTSRICVIRMKNMPMSIANIDKATDELLYIAKGSEVDYIREATTPEEKQRRFLEFWAKRNPNPKGSNNDLMEEYYARVEYANKNFQGYLEGWKTDRGMVFIRFGPPQNIERHPFDSDNKPYEIWYYYNENREFIFVDETGFGDYRLRYPETDLWGRVR